MYHTNFSVFGLAFTFSLGMVLIIISFCLEQWAKFIRRKKGFDQYPLLEWHSNSTLQLHRMVHEALGYGRWQNSRNGVPITEKGDLLAVIDVDNPHHMKLKEEENYITDHVLLQTEKVESCRIEDLGNRGGQDGQSDQSSQDIQGQNPSSTVPDEGCLAIKPGIPTIQEGSS